MSPVEVRLAEIRHEVAQLRRTLADALHALQNDEWREQVADAARAQAPDRLAAEQVLQARLARRLERVRTLQAVRARVAGLTEGG